MLRSCSLIRPGEKRCLRIALGNTLAPSRRSQPKPAAISVQLDWNKRLLVCKPVQQFWAKSISMVSLFRQYYFNLTGMAQPSPTTPHWELLYQATAAYGVSDLNLENMLSIYRDMLADPKVFER